MAGKGMMAGKGAPSLAVVIGAKPKGDAPDADEPDSDDYEASDEEYMSYAKTIFDDKASMEERTKALKQFVMACM